MRRYLHILTLIAFLGSVIAPACGFSWGGKYSVIEICTAQGIEARVVSNEQNPDKSPDHKTTDQCQFCFASTNLTSFLPPIIMVSENSHDLEKLRLQSYEVSSLSRFTSYEEPRGPPALV